ncbi:hypothetical protein MIR68_012411 [Amoeboaphelidium protococcarum]|nr:hypothetical protein MIR68_012411 [Amoeboaphelidium protococcarum]
MQLACLTHASSLKLALSNNMEVKKNKPLMEFIKPMSRLRDLEGSGSIFHFRKTNNIAAARRDFLRNASWSMDSTPEMRRDFLAPALDPIAETKTVVGRF